MNDDILVGVAGPGPTWRIVRALQREGITAVIEAGSIDALVRECADRRPHVAVLVADGDPGPGLRRVSRTMPRTRLVAVIPAPDRALVRAALAAGADGVVVAADIASALGATVRCVRAGQAVVPRTAAGTLHREALSERERQVLELVEAGLGNAEIADRLCVTEHTVKSHLGSVFAKLGVHSRAEALAAHAGGAGTPESRDPIVPRLVRPA